MKIQVNSEEARALEAEGHTIEHYMVVGKTETVVAAPPKKKRRRLRMANKGDAPARAAKRKRNIGTTTRDITVYRMLRKRPNFNSPDSKVAKAYAVILALFTNNVKTQTRLELSVALEKKLGLNRLQSQQRIAGLRAAGYMGIVTL